MPNETVRALEAILLVAEEPITTGTLSQILELPRSRAEELCKELAASYEVDSRGFIVVQVAGGWRLQTHPDLAPFVERFVVQGQSSRLSAAALETLAIVAYKQPISRAQVAAIRGVNVEGVMRTLDVRGYIADIGRDPGPGQAVLFGTTRQFLEKLGLDSIEDLPSLSDFVPGPEIVEALEVGLSPSSEDVPHDDLVDLTPDDRSVESSPGPVPARAVDDRPDSPEAQHDRSSSPDPDPTTRLDEATDRLDALVEEVKSRLEATERALDRHDDDGETGADQHDTDIDGDARPDGATAPRADDHTPPSDAREQEGDGNGGGEVT